MTAPARLRAGAASVSIAPPVGVDLMGYLRRSEPALGYGEPMEATALVLDDGSTRIVLVGADLIGATGTWAQGSAIASGPRWTLPPHHVLLNSQHTHAAPPTPGWAKIGGDAEWNDEETRYGDAVGDLVVSAAVRLPAACARRGSGSAARSPMRSPSTGGSGSRAGRSSAGTPTSSATGTSQ